MIGDISVDATVPLAAKLWIALSLLGGIGTNFSLLSAAYTIAIALLFGLTIAMIVYQLRQRRAAAARNTIALGSGAMASGIVGVGCAACGSLILGVLLPSLGATGALAALPLNGEEFGILSVALLLVSPALASKNVAESIDCALTPRRSRGADGETPDRPRSA